MIVPLIFEGKQSYLWYLGTIPPGWQSRIRSETLHSPRLLLKTETMSRQIPPVRYNQRAVHNEVHSQVRI